MTEKISTETKPGKSWCRNQGCSWEALYGVGMLGAWFYYFTTAPGFLDGVLGFFKGIVWPAFLVFESMRALGM